MPGGDYLALKAELQLPAYSGMTNAQAVTSLNTPITSPNDREYADIADVFECVTIAEYNALTTANRALYEIILKMPQVNVKGTNTREWFTTIFAGAGFAATRARLNTLQKAGTTTRAIQVFGAAVTTNDVAAAKAM